MHATSYSAPSAAAGPGRRRASGVRDTPPARVLDRLHVFVERALRDLERGRGPGGTAARELFLRDPDLDRVFHSVHGDDIPVADEGDGAPDLRLRDDVPDAEAVRSGGRRPCSGRRVVAIRGGRRRSAMGGGKR